MDNSQTLELQIQSKASEAKLSVEGLVKSLTNVENVLTNIYLEMGRIEKNGLKTTAKNVENLKQTVDKTTTSASKLGSSLKTAFTYAGVKRLTTTLLGWMDEAVNYTEQLNLFNVVFNNIEKNGKKTFSTLGEEATRFQYKLNEKFGTNKTETLYMQGIFQSMGETVGIKDKYSAIMSETMTKLTYDLASLYNKGEEATAEAIRAGVYAGQTKPLRAFGIDVTQMSMQPILNELGIDSQVKELSQAEKEILRYLATLKQAKIAMGDFANNLESPANQMKIFKQQLVETKVALSSLFIGTFAKILPYANAILMVIKEVTKAIATMFGIELKDYNTGIASQEGVYDGIADSAGKATKKAKELKRTLFGWDEVHNIDENKDSGSGSGTSVGGGIDQRLLDAIKGYDNGMDKVRMKATEIRNKIMEWLGFTKEIDPLTGKVSFKLKDGYSNLKLIGGIIATLVGFKIFKGLTNVAKSILGVDSLLTMSGKNLTTIGKLVKSLKVSGWGATIGKIASRFSSLASTLGMSVGTLGLVAGAIVAIGGALIYAYNTNDGFRTKVQDMVSSVKKLFSELFGAISTTCYQIWDVIEPIWTIIKNTVVSIVKYMYESVVLNFSLIFDAINGTCKIISDLIHGDFNQAFEDAKQMVADLFGDWNTWFEKIEEIFGNLANNIIDSIFEFVPKAINKLTDILTWIKELPNKFFYYAGLAVGTLWKTITKTNWSELGKKVLNGIVNGIKNIGNSLLDFGAKLWNKTWESIKNVRWADLGKNILDGIIGGMFNVGKKLKNWGKSFVKGIKDALGIESKKDGGVYSNGNWQNIPQRANGGIYSNGSWKDIPQYANGGTPNHGSLVFAGENGPEILGNANGKTEILNKSQIASSIYSAVYSAMSQFNGGGVAEINVHASKDVIVETAINGINQQTNQTGVCPVKMPAY